MRMKTILKENTTPRCHESFILEKHTMVEREDLPWSEMLVSHLLMDKPFGRGGSMPSRGGGSGPLGGGGSNPPGGANNEHLRNQNPRSYIARLASLWIGPTWNLWYPSWYHFQAPITPNFPSSIKSLPYPIYTTWMDIDVHARIFCKAI